MSIWSDIKAVFSPPDPKRFAYLGEATPGWGGELAGMPRKARERVEERVRNGDLPFTNAIAEARNVPFSR